MIPLFFNKKNKIYYTDNMYCSTCQKEFEQGDLVFIYSEFGKSFSYTSVLCQKCVRKANKKSFGIIKEIKPCFYVDEIPKNSFPVFQTNPQLKTFGGETVWSASYKDSVKSKDKTRLAKNKLLVHAKQKELTNEVGKNGI